MKDTSLTLVLYFLPKIRVKIFMQEIYNRTDKFVIHHSWKHVSKNGLKSKNTPCYELALLIE